MSGPDSPAGRIRSPLEGEGTVRPAEEIVLDPAGRVSLPRSARPAHLTPEDVAALAVERLVGVRLVDGEEFYSADWLSDAYEPDDPKSPGYHGRTADIWDLREKGS